MADEAENPYAQESAGAHLRGAQMLKPSAYGALNSFPSTAESVETWLDAINLVRAATKTRVSFPGEKWHFAHQPLACCVPLAGGAEGRVQQLGGGQLPKLTTDDLKQLVPIAVQRRRIVRVHLSPIMPLFLFAHRRAEYFVHCAGDGYYGAQR